jgi:hypothetical protein
MTKPFLSTLCYLDAIHGQFPVSENQSILTFNTQNRIERHTVAGLIAVINATPVPAHTTMRSGSIGEYLLFTSSKQSPFSYSSTVRLYRPLPSTPSGQPVVPRTWSNAIVRVVELALRSACFCLSEYKLSGESRKRVPRAAPEAPSVRTEATCAP